MGMCRRCRNRKARERYAANLDMSPEAVASRLAWKNRYKIRSNIYEHYYYYLEDGQEVRCDEKGEPI